jgi:hypothetical protein
VIYSLVSSLPALFVLVYLPGALLFRAPVADRDRRARLEADERAFWAVVVSVACSSLFGLALAALGLYTLARLVALDLAVSMAIVAAWRRRLLYGPPAAAPGWALAIPLALVVLGWALFFPPAEHVVGGKDPGVYVNAGIQIAQRGSLVVHDPLVAAIPARLRDLFFRPYGDAHYYSNRFMGFFILDPRTGSVVSQLPHLYPLWVAIGYGLGGVRGALATTGCWATLGLLAVYVTGRRLAGRAGAAAAAALLALSVVQVWFARDPNAEMLGQPLLFAALAAFSRAHVDRDRYFAPVAGVLLGLLLFLRVDAVLAVAGVGAAVMLQFLDHRRPRLGFLLPLAAVGAFAWLYLTRLMAAYAALPLGFIANLRPADWGLLALAAVALAGLALAARRERAARVLRPAVTVALVASVVAGAIYAYFFRTPGGRLAPHDADSLRVFAWYLPPAALAAAVAGFALLAWRSCWKNLAWFVTAAVYAFFVFYKIRIVPEHFWMTRRFLPMVLPAALLALGGLAFDSWRPDGARVRTWLLGPRGLRLAIGLVFVGLVGSALARASAPVARHVEYAGVIARLDALAARFDAGDLVVVESRDTRSDLHVLALPLAYIYGRHVLLLDSAKPDKLMFQQFLEWAGTRYRHVYFLGGGGTDLLSRSISVTPVASERFQVPEYDSPLNAYPRGVRFKEFDFGIYRFEPRAAATPPTSFDIGAFDDLNVVRFHAKERTGDTAFRWTTASSYVTIPGLAAAARRLTLWMSSGGRPAKAPAALVTVSFDGRPLGTVTVTDGFHAYGFDIPAELASAAAARDEPALVRLVSTTWSPHDLLGTPDDRRLGVMVQRVEVQ